MQNAFSVGWRRVVENGKKLGRPRASVDTEKIHGFEVKGTEGESYSQRNGCLANDSI